jgi:hypothetical protein
VAIQRLAEQQPLGAAAVEIHAAHHLVFRARRAIACIAAGAEGLDRVQPALLAHNGLRYGG